MEGIPTIALRADLQMVPRLFTRYAPTMLKMLPYARSVQGPVQNFIDRAGVTDPFVQRLLDIECFLLSGLKADETIAAEIAFMFGERNLRKVEYPLGGAEAIVEAMARGIEKFGGELRTRAHVDKVIVESGKARGVTLRSGEEIRARTVISNASLWDTYEKMVGKQHLPARFLEQQSSTPAVDSFMHLHLGIDASDLQVDGHHVVVHDSTVDITTPGNTVMVSIASVFDPALAPKDKHVVHAYTLEPFSNWTQYEAGVRPRGSREQYEAQKCASAEPLYAALRRIIPDLDQRVEVADIGTPLTHKRYLRRHRGTYGPAIVAGKDMFPGPATPIAGLYRVGDSVVPGIGVPAVVASGMLCANALVSPAENDSLLRELNYH